jgi:hypothetical protein
MCILEGWEGECSSAVGTLVAPRAGSVSWHPKNKRGSSPYGPYARRLFDRPFVPLGALNEAFACFVNPVWGTLFLLPELFFNAAAIGYRLL